MPDSGRRHSALPWILLFSAAAACVVCAACGTGGILFWFVSRPAAPSPTARIVASPTIPVAPTVEPAQNPLVTRETPVPTPSQDPISGPDSWRSMGVPGAAVVVEEFGDFQCPFCSRFHSRLEPRLREEYIADGKIRFIFRNFLVVDSFVAGGNESRMAALGALCAGEQGRFWEYHDVLFENQSGENDGAFSRSHLRNFAQDLDLDGDSFTRCLDEERYEDILRQDERMARDLHLKGVPSVLINGELLDDIEGDALFEAIDDALRDA
jgi:protein-disulfide isomerase